MSNVSHKSRITRRTNAVQGILNRVDVAHPYADPTHPPEDQLTEVITAIGLFSGWEAELESAINDLERFDQEMAQWADARPDPDERTAAINEHATHVGKNGGLNETIDRAQVVQGTVRGRIKEAIVFKATMQDALAQQQQQQQPQVQQPVQQGPAVMPQTVRSNAQLTPLKGETFDGKLERWIPFWEFFTSEVDTQNFTETVKFRYLKNYLEGKPLLLLEGLSVTAANYADAIDLLKREYGDKDRLVHHLYTKIEMYTPRSESPQDMWLMLQCVEGMLRQLKSLGEDIERSGCRQMLSTILVRKIPNQLLRDMTMSRAVADRNKDWSPTEFCDTLRELLRTNERLSEHSQHSEAGSKWPHKSEQRPKHSNVFSAVHTFNRHNMANNGYDSRNNNVQMKRNNVSCAFCSGGHYSNTCKKYATLSERQSVCRQNNLCFLCLKQHKGMGTCQVRMSPCYYCKTSSHNSALCRTKFGNFNDNRMNMRGNSKQQGIKPLFNQLAKVNTIHNSHRGSPSQNRQINHGRTQTDRGAQAQTTVNQVTSDQIETTQEVKHRKTRLMTAAVTVSNPATNDTVRVRTFLDPGSEITFVSEELSDKLNFQHKGTVILPIQAFGPEKITEMETPLVDLQLRNADTNEQCDIHAHVVPRAYIAQLQNQPQPTESDWHYIRKMPIEALAEQPNEMQLPIEILIGIDHFFELFDTDYVLPSGLSVLSSKFGLIIAGQQKTQSEKNSNKVKVHEVHKETTVNMVTDDSVEWGRSIQLLKNDEKTGIEQFDLFHHPWQLDEKTMSDLTIEGQLDEEAIKQFDESVKILEDGRIEVGWGFIPNHKPFKTNFGLAKARLASLINNLNKAPGTMEKYAEAMNKLHMKGIIEDAPWEPDGPDKIHYLPHHGVFNLQKKTTPVRPVFDASAKTGKDDVSLNDCLLKGACKLPEIPAMMVYFRTHKTILLADIEGAFHQVQLRPEDRDCVRFIWLKDWKQGMSEGNLRIMRFTRLTMGMKESPYLLEMAIKAGLTAQNSQLGNDVKDRLYVDNLMVGFHDNTTLNEFYTEIKQLFANIKMNLREFITNSEDFNSKLPTEDALQSEVIKVLGVQWDIETDTIGLSMPKVKTTPNVKPKHEQEALTKREIMVQTMKQYDPNGLFLPILVRAKILIQRLFQLNYEWDQTLPTEINAQWEELLQEITQAKNIRIPRFIPLKLESEYKFHCFVDASQHAYAAALYVCIQMGTKYESFLLLARNNLAPSNKKLTIPRLELMAAVLGHKLIQYVLESNQLHTQPKEVHMFIDSQVVLNWIRTESGLGVFVENRVSQLRSANYKYHYIESENNPADLATRYATAKELTDENHIWWKGPDYLTKEQTDWPIHNIPQIDQEMLAEIAKAKANKPQLIHMPVNAVVLNETQDEQIIDPSRFSDINKLHRTVALVFRFIKKQVYNKITADKQTRIGFVSKHSETIQSDGPITAREMQIARIWMECQTQRMQYNEEIQLIKNGQKNQLIHSLGLQLDDNERLVSVHRQMNADSQVPLVLMPRNMTYTNMLIMNTHVTRNHAGIQDTLAFLRQKYWITAGRAAVRHALTNCVTCKRNSGPAYPLPKMPPLPAERVNESPPFTYIAVDYAGPIMTREDDHENGNKRYVALFTCMSTRAVHMELVSNASAWAFCLALREMIARRGAPKKIYSDNGTQFVFTEKMLREKWVNWGKENDLLQYCAENNIQWTFNVPKSSWSLGVVERMIGITKKSLKAAIGRRLLKTEELRVLLVETEAVVNSRPITYVYADRDSYTVLRPMDFIMPGRKNGIATWDVDLTDPDYTVAPNQQQLLAEQWTKIQNQLNKFWEMWSREYLVSLREYQQIEHRHGRLQTNEAPKEGDVVIINEEPLQRGAWKIGRIIRLLETVCDEPRAAELQLPNGHRLTRPINLLHPFETTSEINPEQKDKIMPMRIKDPNIEESDEEDENDDKGRMKRATMTVTKAPRVTKNMGQTALLGIVSSITIAKARASDIEIRPNEGDNETWYISCLMIMMFINMIYFIIRSKRQKTEPNTISQSETEDKKYLLAQEKPVKSEVATLNKQVSLQSHTTPKEATQSKMEPGQQVKVRKTTKTTMTAEQFCELKRQNIERHTCRSCVSDLNQSIIRHSLKVSPHAPLWKLKQLWQSVRSLELDSNDDRSLSSEPTPPNFASDWLASTVLNRAKSAGFVKSWHVHMSGHITIKCRDNKNSRLIHGYDERADQTNRITYQSNKELIAVAELFVDSEFGTDVHFHLYTQSEKIADYIAQESRSNVAVAMMQDTAHYLAHNHSINEEVAYRKRTEAIVERMKNLSDDKYPVPQATKSKTE